MAKHDPTRAHPHNLPAERAVLGALLVDRLCLPAVQAIGLSATHFYRPEHGALFSLLETMTARGEVVDLITVPERVAREGGDRFGGAAYVLQLPDHAPSTANVTHYAREILADWRRREAIALYDESREATAGGVDEFEEVAARTVGRLLELGSETAGKGPRPVWEALDVVVAEAVRALDEDDPAPGLKTGLRDLDRLTGGVHPGDLVIIAGRPGHGKSALALNICEQVAMSREARGFVALWSMEMPASQVARRSLATRSGVSSHLLRAGTIDDDQLDTVQRAHARLREDLAGLYVDDSRGLTIGRLCARARALAQRLGGLDLVAVDYLQLLRGELGRTVSRESEVAHASSELKSLAGELGCPVLALSQLNRKSEERNDKRPLVADLRESGAIEQDADMVWLLFRPELAWPEPDRRANPGRAELHVAKNRHGQVGILDLNYQAALTRFTSLTLAQIQAQSRPDRSNP